MWNKTQINVPYTTVYLYNSQLQSYCTKNKVTIKPKYKEKILLHERTKNLHLYTSLRTTKSQINKF